MATINIAAEIIVISPKNIKAAGFVACDLLTFCASPEAVGTDYTEYNKHITSNDYMVSSVHRDASVGRSVTINLPRVVDRIPLLRKSVSSRVI